ncbi:MAG: hypothetical protein Kow0037_05700 [Calditrichia bacterium]
MKTVFRQFLFCLFLTTALVAQPLHFPVDTLAMDEYFNYRGYPKFDPDGFLHVVWTRQLDINSATREIFYAHNRNGSFTIEQLTNNSVDDNYATLAIDSQGAVHICFERRDSANQFQLMYTHNRSGSFMTPIWITSGGANKATPFMALGHDDRVHFVYYTFQTGPDHVYYRSYDLNSQQLGPEVLLGPGEASSENDAVVQTDSQNHVHIVFDSNSFLKYFNDLAGNLQEVPTVVTVGIEYPQLIVDRTDQVHFLYRNSGDRRLYTFRYNGSGFTQPEAITPPNSGRPSFYRSIAVDDSLRLYAVYQNSISGAPKGFYLVYGTPGNYVQPRLVFEDSTGTYSSRVSCAVAARGNGEVAVLYSPGGLRNSNVISDIFIQHGYLFGNPSLPQIHFSPDSLDFGMVALGDSLELNLEIRNTGNSLLTLDSAAFSQFTGQFFLNIMLPDSLPPDSSRLLPVVFKPTQIEPLITDTLLLFNNSPVSPALIPLRGAAWASAISDPSNTPTSWELLQVYPNPFNPQTRILAKLLRAEKIELSLFNSLGQKIKTLYSGKLPAGEHRFTLQAHSLSSGKYFLRMIGKDISETRSVILLK